MFTNTTAETAASVAETGTTAPTPSDMPQTTSNAGTAAPTAGSEPAQPSDKDKQTASKTDELADLSPEQLIKMLKDTRRESARYRNERNELKPLAQKYQEQIDAKKSDLEKALEKIEQLESEKAAADLAATRAKISASTGVPVDLLPAGTEEEITSAAEKLKTWADSRRESQTPNRTAPYVPSVGRGSGGDDRDSQARRILGV